MPCGLDRDGRDFVVVQIKEPQVWHFRQRFPGKAGEGVSIQPELVQVVKAPEAVDTERVERIERHPEELQVVQVVEVVGRNPSDRCLFDAQLGRVGGEIWGNHSELWIITKDTPAKVQLKEVVHNKW